MTLYFNISDDVRLRAIEAVENTEDGQAFSFSWRSSAPDGLVRTQAAQSLAKLEGLQDLSLDAATPQQSKLAQGLLAAPPRPWRGPPLSSIRLARSRLARAQAALYVGSQGELVQAPEVTPETPAELSEPLLGAIAEDAAAEHFPADRSAKLEGLQDLSLDAAIPQQIELAQGLLSDEDGTARWEALQTAVPRLDAIALKLESRLLEQSVPIERMVHSEDSQSAQPPAILADLPYSGIDTAVAVIQVSTGESIGKITESTNFDAAKTNRQLARPQESAASLSHQHAGDGRYQRLERPHESAGALARRHAGDGRYGQLERPGESAASRPQAPNALSVELQPAELRLDAAAPRQLAPPEPSGLLSPLTSGTSGTSWWQPRQKRLMPSLHPLRPRLPDHRSVWFHSSDRDTRLSLTEFRVCIACTCMLLFEFMLICGGGSRSRDGSSIALGP